MKRWTMVAAMLAVMMCAPGARATVGGPTTCDVLGWDAAARRVYVHMQPGNAGSMFGTVGYFAVGGAAADTLVPAPWSRDGEGTMEDPDLQRRLAALRARLQPLVRRTAIALPWKHSIVRRDSLGSVWSAPRFRVRLSYEGEDDFEVTTFHLPWVSRIAVLQIPGRTETLQVFSFVGHPEEGGYETQVPVLVGPGGPGMRILRWWNGGD